MSPKRSNDMTMVETVLRLLTYLRRPHSRYDVARMLGCSNRTALRLMQSMRDLGLVESYTGDDRVTQYVAVQQLAKIKRADRSVTKAA